MRDVSNGGWVGLQKNVHMTFFRGQNQYVTLPLPIVQGRSKLDNWGGGTHIHIYVFTHHKNNRFQKKLIVQNTNI